MRISDWSSDVCSSDLAVFVVFREQVIKRLLPFRAHRLGNGFPPFLGIREFGIDIENDAPEWKQTVPHDIANRKSRFAAQWSGSISGVSNLLHPYSCGPTLPSRYCNMSPRLGDRKSTRLNSSH